MKPITRRLQRLEVAHCLCLPLAGFLFGVWYRQYADLTGRGLCGAIAVNSRIITGITRAAPENKGAEAVSEPELDAITGGIHHQQ